MTEYPLYEARNNMGPMVLVNPHGSGRRCILLDDDGQARGCLMPGSWMAYYRADAQWREEPIPSLWTQFLQWIGLTKKE